MKALLSFRFSSFLQKNENPWRFPFNFIFLFRYKGPLVNGVMDWNLISQAAGNYCFRELRKNLSVPGCFTWRNYQEHGCGHTLRTHPVEENRTKYHFRFKYEFQSFSLCRTLRISCITQHAAQCTASTDKKGDLSATYRRDKKGIAGREAILKQA